jgi:hypothetical protein
MKILNLRTENLKGVKIIDITPKDDVIIISGKNGAGKTSALDSIWYAMEWRAGAKGTPMPIRKGEKQASVQLTLCEDLTKEQIEQGIKPKPLFIVYRYWLENGYTRLKVTNAEGIKQEPPQELLDRFIGYLSFDPRLFAQMDSKAQRDLLIEVTGFDVAGIEEKIADLREQRRLQGQKVKLLSGAREEITIKDLPELPVDVSKLSDKYDEAVKLNNDIEKQEEGLRHNNNGINEDIDKISRLKEEIKELQNEIKDLESENIVVEKANKQIREWLSKNKTINTDGIKSEITNAYNINEQIKTRERNKEADKKQKEAQKVYDEFTQEIDKSITEMEDGLKKSWSKIPDQRLSLTETGVAYDGIPYSQISFSEQLRVAMGIAMALNTKFKVIRISDYSLLDDDSRKVIRQMAKDGDYQILAEEVDSSGEVGFYMEDGELVDKKG